jgi:hypothetical protein
MFTAIFITQQWGTIESMSKAKILVLFLVLPIPVLASQTVQNFFGNLLAFVNSTLILALMAVAFVAFIFNVVRYFLIASANEDGREQAKGFAVYSVLAFTMIVVFWGLINFFVDSLGLPDCADANISDYINKDAAPCIAPIPNSRP